MPRFVLAPRLLRRRASGATVWVLKDMPPWVTPPGSLDPPAGAIYFLPILYAFARTRHRAFGLHMRNSPPSRLLREGFAYISHISHISRSYRSSSVRRRV